MSFDVIVVGGGPTGLWLACELALARVRVAVLEKAAEPTGLSKALGLQSRSMEMLEHRGILDRFTAGNPTPPFLNFGMFPLDLRGHDFAHPYGVVMPHAREALLQAHAKDQRSCSNGHNPSRGSGSPSSTALQFLTLPRDPGARL